MSETTTKRMKRVTFNFQLPQGKSRSKTDKRDFLRSEAQTPLSEKLVAGGMVFEFWTNSKRLLEISGSCSERPAIPEEPVEVRLRIWVDPLSHSGPRWPKPYFRGLDDLIFLGFDARNSLLVDLRKGRILGRLTEELATDEGFWKIVIFPVLVAILASAAGRAVLHCACVAWNGKGILLAGDSGSGKSTLSLSLAQNGLGFVSDDRTLFSLCNGRLMAHGLGPCIKLRPDATAHFGSFKNQLSVNWPSEEGAIHLDPVLEFGLKRIAACEPTALFFLERADDPQFALRGISAREAALRLEDGLTRESFEAEGVRQQVIDSLVERECYAIRCGGNPYEIACSLGEFLAGRLTIHKPTSSQPSPLSPGLTVLKQDPLRRFTPTPWSADFYPMGRRLRVETDSPVIMDHARRAFRRYGQSTNALPDFRWRLISDSTSRLAPPWPEMTAFSDQNLRYINLGQQSFIAADLESREAVAFVSDSLLQDEAGFTSIVVAALFYLSAGAMALTAISAACLAYREKGLLLFGVPRSGKTTSCFMASGHGYQFHADQACFLEIQDGSLQAWGEFWPAAFHPESSEYLPDLVEHSLPFVHRDARYLCMEKDFLSRVEVSSIEPVACVYLEREATHAPKLIPLCAREFKEILAQGIPFKDQAGPEEARSAVYAALNRLPAYRLVYDDTPAVPSLFFRSLLNSHRMVERLG